MGERNSSAVDTGALSQIVPSAELERGDMSLDALTLLVNTERLNHLHKSTQQELVTLRGRQEQVRHLHKLMNKINAHTSESGELDCSQHDEIKELLKLAKEIGVELNVDKHKYGKDERDRLIENLRLNVEDLNVMNDMHMQTINRLTNERYESFQMARSILKPLHEAKMQHAKGIGGR